MDDGLIPRSAPSSEWIQESPRSHPLHGFSKSSTEGEKVGAYPPCEVRPVSMADPPWSTPEGRQETVLTANISLGFAKISLGFAQSKKFILNAVFVIPQLHLFNDGI